MTRQALRLRRWRTAGAASAVVDGAPGTTSATAKVLFVVLLIACLFATSAFALEAGLDGSFDWWGLGPTGRATVGLTVLLLLYVATFYAYWRPRRLQARPFALVTAIGLAAVSGVLGIVSYWGCEGGEAWLWTPVNHTLALFIGNVADPFGSAESCPAPMPVALQAARITALFATLTTVAAAIMGVFRDQWDRLQVRLTRSVVLVVGLDTQSMRILEVLAKDPDVTEMVVGVDTEVGALSAAEARAFGARVLRGNKADLSWLRTLSRTTIRATYLLSPRPEENLSWFVGVERLVRDRAKGKSRWSESSRVIVRLDDRWEADHWRRAHVLTAGGVLLDTIGVLQVTAQELLHHAIGRGVDSLVVLGNSPLASAVVDELAQHWREQATLTSPRRFAITLVDPEAELLWEDHEFHERSFGNEPLPVTRRTEAANARVITEAIADAGGDSGDPGSVVVIDCREPSAAQYRSSQRLCAARPHWLVLVRREDGIGIDKRPTMPSLIPFGLTLVTRDGVPEDGWTRIARRLHTKYVEGRKPDKPTRLPWDELDDFLRLSNLRQVASTLLIADVAGRTWDPGDGSRKPLPLTQEEIAAHAHLEHEDWKAYYEANGWTYGEDDDWVLKQSPYLVPWSDLTDEDTAATIDGVTNSLQQLTTLGYHPFRKGATVPAMRPLGRYRRGGVVTAVRQDSHWSWTTKAGDVLPAGAGDWRVVADGRTWSVRDEAFQATYRHLDGDQWERIGVVSARQVATGEQVGSPEGLVNAQPGDWVVEDDEHRRWVVPEGQFRQNYRAV